MMMPDFDQHLTKNESEFDHHFEYDQHFASLTRI
jgi:hypothetical protein